MLTFKDILEDLDKFCIFPDADFSEDDFYNLKQHYYLSKDSSYDNIISPLENNWAFAKEKWDYDSGVSKLVLIFENLPYVIKIPFQGGQYYSSFSYTNYRGNTVHQDSECNLFQNAGYNLEEMLNHFWDYCEAEAAIFSLAEEANLSDCFAETKLIGYVQNYPIYAQEKGIIFGDDHISTTDSSTKKTIRRYSEIKEPSKKSKEKANQIYSTYDCDRLHPDWIADFIEYWGEKRMIDLLTFIKEKNLSDLHSGNIGYIEDRPVLFDYGGYNS